MGWLSGLNDFRTETPYVRSNMAAIYEYWINQIGFDGFRVDTALEVDQGCWQTFCPAIHACAATNGNTNFFMFGEAFSGSETTVGSYTGTEGGGPFKFDSVLDYPLYFAVNSVFARASGATSLIQNHYNAVAANYDPAAQMQLVTFLDNHDNPRFLSTSEANNNTNRLEVALAFLYTAPGIPCLYYGTEQGFDGTTDPNDREDMFAGEFKNGPGGTVSQLSSPGVDNFNMTHPLFQWVAQLNNFRRLYPALTLGSYVNRANNSSGPGLFAYSRVLNTQEVFVVFNTASSSQTLPASTLTYPAGTVLVNLLNTERNLHSDRRLANSGHHRARHRRKNLYRAIAVAAAGPGGDEQLTCAPDNQCADFFTHRAPIQQADGYEQRSKRLQHQANGRRRVQLVARERQDDVHRRWRGSAGFNQYHSKSDQHGI